MAAHPPLARMVDDLIAALLANPPSDREESLARLRDMGQRWVPAANAVLRDRAPDFMQELWLDLGPIAPAARRYRP